MGSVENDRVSVGFDLRVDPRSQKERPWDRSQRLSQDLLSPVSADSAVWLRPKHADQLFPGTIPPFGNPLNLAKGLDLLEKATEEVGARSSGLWPICVTSDRANIVVLKKRCGPHYFDYRPEEGQLLSEGWRFLGFDVVQLNGALISALKGCGYVEPGWSQLRRSFGDALNEFGLFADPDSASRFAEMRSLEILEHAPFKVVGLLTRDPLP